MLLCSYRTNSAVTDMLIYKYRYRPSAMVEEALVDVMEQNIREKCLQGFTFVLEPADTV